MLGQRAGQRDYGLAYWGVGGVSGELSSTQPDVVRHASMNAAEKLRGTQRLSLAVSVEEANWKL